MVSKYQSQLPNTLSAYTLTSATFHTSSVCRLLQVQPLVFSCNDVAKKVFCRNLPDKPAVYCTYIQVQQQLTWATCCWMKSPDTCLLRPSGSVDPVEAEGGKRTEQTNINRAVAAGGGRAEPSTRSWRPQFDLGPGMPRPASQCWVGDSPSRLQDLDRLNEKRKYLSVF